jgi:cell division initiation protein
MKLTPLDIHHKEFRHSIRGYSEEEVDQFLDEVADEFERLFKENIDLTEKAEALQSKVNDFEMQRQTINNTLVTAQRSADDIVARANAEAEGIVDHANVRAKEIVNDALAKKQQVRGELLRIKQAEEEFRERYRALLESNLKSITAVELSDDVSVLLGETDEPVEAKPEPVFDAPAQTPAQMPVSAPEAIEVADFAPQPPKIMPATMIESAPEPDDDSGPVNVFDLGDSGVVAQSGPMPASPQSTSPLEPPASGFVSSVALGELEAPELPADVDLVEPSEFSLPGFDALGEREDDIEEID